MQKQRYFGMKMEGLVFDKLVSIANITKRSKSFIVQEALKEHLTDLEIAYRADKIYEDVCAGKIKTISQKEIEKEYGIEE